MGNSEDGFDSPDMHARIVLEMALADVDRALRMAEIRAEPLGSLIDRLPAILNDDDREQIIYRFREVQLGDSEATALANRIEQLAIDWEALPSKAKARADAILGHLIQALPEPHRSRLALSFLPHPRKRRREAAYRILRDAEIPSQIDGALIALADSIDDQELFHLIARNPRIVAASDERALIEKIEDEYWQMRVIEALLREDPERGARLAPTYPVLFVRAVGRLEAHEHRPLLRELFAEHLSDPAFLSIYAWVLGRFADIPGLREVCSAMVALRERLEDQSGA